MTVLVAIAIIIGAAIVSWSLVAGIVWIGCLIAGVAFSWRYAMAAWLIILLIRFVRGGKNG